MNCKETHIVGGGPVGCLLALLLHERGLASTLLDAREPGTPLPDRTLALSWLTVQLLLDHEIIDQRFLTPIRRIQIGQSHPWAGVELEASDVHLDALGYTVRYAVLQSALEAAIIKRGISFHGGVAIASIERSASWAFATTESDELWASKALVLAEGGHIKPKGWSYKEHRYDQHAWVAFLPCLDTHGVAYERFTERGILAFLPDRNGTTLIFSLKDEHYQSWQSLSRSDQNQWLKQACPTSLVWSSEWVERVSLPLRFQALRSKMSPPIWVCGNASQMMHPVAALGFNLGVRDVLDTASSLHQFFYPSLEAKLQNGLGWGRNLDRRCIQRVSDVLARLGHEQSGLWRSIALEKARGFGLKIMQHTPELKSVLLNALIFGL